jgi:hypothetical protein
LGGTFSWPNYWLLNIDYWLFTIDYIYNAI